MACWPKIINAQVPLGEMFGYATDLRSATQGRATYSMEFAEYAEAPKRLQLFAEAVIKQTRVNSFELIGVLLIDNDYLKLASNQIKVKNG